MKRILALLLAVNAAVLGILVYQQIGQTEVWDGGVHELSRPTGLNPQNPPNEQTPDWAAVPENNATIAEPESEEAAALRLQEEQARKRAQEQARKAREAAQAARLQENSEQRPCMSTANITIDEDDYHRIKGLLTSWPHAAARSIERRESGANSQQMSFSVWLPAEGDGTALIDALNRKGFTATANNGRVFVGNTPSRSSAQVLVSRLAGAGFPGADISETASARLNQPLSVARMHITFMMTAETDLQALRDVVGRYGHLQVKACR